MIDFELTIPKIKRKQFVGFPAVQIDPKKIMEKTSEIQYEIFSPKWTVHWKIRNWKEAKKICASSVLIEI